MKCENCGENSDTFVLLPAKEPDGSLNKIVCYTCALGSSRYCEKHQMPHLGFADDETTACRLCIEETIRENKDKAGKVYFILRTELPREQVADLNDWTDASSSITGNSRTICVLRAVVTKALRLNTSIEKVVKKVIEDQSVDLILPKIF